MSFAEMPTTSHTGWADSQFCCGAMCLYGASVICKVVRRIAANEKPLLVPQRLKSGL